MKSLKFAASEKFVNNTIFGVFVLVAVISIYIMESALSMRGAMQKSVENTGELIVNYGTAHSFFCIGVASSLILVMLFRHFVKIRPTPSDSYVMAPGATV